MTLFRNPGRWWNFAVAVIFFGAAALCHAQESATIRIESGVYAGGQVFPVFTGPGAEEAAKILRADLEFDGRIPLAGDQAAAMLHAQGTVTGAAINARLIGANSQVILEEQFNGGSLRQNVHAFADAIVEKLTGSPGYTASKIAFISSRSGNKEVYICDYDGANPVQLTSDRSIAVSPKISADRSKVLYSSYKNGYCDVYEIDIASRQSRTLINWPGTNSSAALSPSGRILVLTANRDGNPELYQTGAGGGRGKRLTATPGVESSPTWGKEEGEIIFSSDTRGTPQLFRMRLNGRGATPLSTGFSYNTEPNWSPDGSKVAFNVRAGGGLQVAILDLGTGSVRTVTSGASCEDPAWGPNSRHLVYRQGASLVTLNTVTGQRTVILSGFGEVSEPSWSR